MGIFGPDDLKLNLPKEPHVTERARLLWEVLATFMYRVRNGEVEADTETRKMGDDILLALAWLSGIRSRVIPYTSDTQAILRDTTDFIAEFVVKSS